jgi:hypothetical protein
VIQCAELMHKFAEVSRVSADMMSSYTEQQANQKKKQHCCRMLIPGMMVLPAVADIVVQVPSLQPVPAAFAEYC